MSELSRDRMRALDVARARTRQHRRCASCHGSRVVCNTCARIYCEACTPRCPRCGEAQPAPPLAPRELYSPALLRRPRRPRTLPPLPLPSDLRLQEVLRLCEDLKPAGIEPHPDSGGWQLVLPVGAGGFDSAAQAAHAVYTRAEDWIQPTSFGSGRLFQPDRWYITMHIR
jgi:hypothetical protein